MPDFAIRTQNLTRDFATVRAVDGLTLDVPAGIIFGFLGPNGAGKTTTIRLLLGLLEPTAGQVEVLDFDVHTQADDVRARTGALLEHSGLYERLSAQDNLEFYAWIWRLPADERRSRIQELLTHLGLWDRRDEAVGTWSRGMKQKLAVARTLLHRPALVFMDEPTAGLDPVAAAALRDDLASLSEREGVTVFLTTHNLTEAEKLCEQVGVIRAGKLVASGDLDELRSRSSVPQLEVTGRGFGADVVAQIRARPEVTGVSASDGRLLIDLTGDVNTASLVGLLANAGAEVEEARKIRRSLEDVFLALVEEDDA